MKKFLRENWVEILTVIAVLLGILVVINREAIVIFINQRLPVLQNDLISLYNRVGKQVLNYLAQLSMVEMVVYALVVSGALFILLRIRYRFLRSQRWRSAACPRCGGELYRVHRSFFDRFLSKTFLPHARRYLCQDPDCKWTGLKNIERGRKSRRTDLDSFSLNSQE